jgi:DNA primase
LGYSPDASDAFLSTALKQQFNKDNLKLSGLVNEREGRWYDNYRNRIIFPVHNNTGKVIGFGARLIKANDKAPKYINTPENELYLKSKILYGLFFARQEIDKNDECLLVEGYTDVISLHQAGVENVVASGGTSLTPDQLRLIRKYTNNLTIIYDGDGAGIKAALRGLDMALEEGLNVHLVLIPDKEDPDSYVQKIGKVAFNEFIKKNKKDFILFQLETALADAGNDSTKKAEIVNRIAESIAKVNKAEDFTKQQDYIRQSAALLKVDEMGLTTLVNKFIREKIGKLEEKALKDKPTPLTPQEQVEQKQYEETLTLLIRNELQERSVVRCLLLYGQNKMDETQNFAKYIFDTLHEFHFDNPLLERITESYRLMNDTGMEPTEKSFVYHEDAELRGMVMSLLEFPYELSLNWDKKLEGMNINNRDTSQADVLQSVNYFKLRKIKQMLEENQHEMEKASTDEQLQMMRVHAELKTIEREITKTLGTVILR